MQPHISSPHTATPDEAWRRRRLRRSALLFALIAAVFYFGFIVMTLVRAGHERPAARQTAVCCGSCSPWRPAARVGFALVPLYNVLCSVTGYGDQAKLLERVQAVGTRK